MGKHNEKSRSRSRSPLQSRDTSHSERDSRSTKSRYSADSAYRVHIDSEKSSREERTQTHRCTSGERSSQRDDKISERSSQRDDKISERYSQRDDKIQKDASSEKPSRNKWSSSGKWDVEACPDRNRPRSKEDAERLAIKAAADLRKRIFLSGQKDEAVMVLLHPETIPIKGKLQIQCLAGAVSVFGYHIRTDNKFHNVYSPETNSRISLRTLKGGGEKSSLVAVKKITTPEQYKELQKCLKSSENPVLILMRSLNHLKLDFIATLKQFQNLFSVPVVKNISLDSVCHFPDLGVSFYPHQTHSYADINVFTVSSDMYKVAETVNNRIKECQKDQRKYPVVVVCGGKGVGKSSLARYLLNSFLNQVGSVALLDCDLGQTEFTPPGCLALSQVSQPMLGPPFTHQMKPIRSCFHGNLSPGDDPALYIRCLRFVYQEASSLNCPVIVNTMGWTQGIGLALMVDTLRMVQPDFVLQIDGPGRNKNFSCLEPKFISGLDGWNEKDVELAHPLDYSLLKFETAISPQMENRDYYKAIDHRTLSLLANLGSMFTTPRLGYQLNSVCPMTIPWDRVAVHVAHVSVPNSQVMYALNASVVALCQLPTDQMISSGVEGYPKFVQEFPVCPCLGFGFIRSIDPEAKVFYMLTPLSSAELTDVNCLVRGVIELPPPLMLNQYDGSDRIPYVGYSKDVIGATSVHRRNYMARRRGEDAD